MRDRIIILDAEATARFHEALKQPPKKLIVDKHKINISKEEDKPQNKGDSKDYPNEEE